MKVLLLCLAVLSFVVAGCGKKASPPARSNTAAPAVDQSSPAEGASAQEPAPAQSPAQPAAASPAPNNTVQPVNGIVDPRLTTQLRIFIRERGRLRESFAEFAGARLDSVPRLSPELRFVIDPATQEVKITT